MYSKKDRDNEEKVEEHRIPLMSKWVSVVDDLINEAVSEGLFDNLPGRGKPLKLITNLFGQESELAFQLLKNNEYTLPWIAERSQLLTEIEEIREEIGRLLAEYSQEYQVAQGEVVQTELKVAWAEKLDEWQENIADFNNRITSINLKQPGGKLEIFKITLEAELGSSSEARA